MKRSQLEHVLRAASAIVKAEDLLVIGSQSVLATWDERRLPGAATRSMEVDITTVDDDESKSDLIDGNIGEGSRFHETYGYYAQGVSLRDAILPAGWRDRLVVLENERTHPGRGMCLDPYDCVASKLAAGRAKDYEFAAARIEAGLIKLDTLAKRVELLESDDLRRAELATWIAGQRRGVERAKGKH